MEQFEETKGQIPDTIKFRTNGEKNARAHRGPKPISEVKSEPIEWLWEPYIPLGRLSMLGGDPGAGKSFITAALASALSRGDPLPGEEEQQEPMNTLMLSVEDDPADTIKPRLMNLQADQTKIFISEEDIILDEEGLRAIETMVKVTNAKLVIIDPIVAFLGAKMDMNRANEVRTIMKGIAKIARKFNIAILVVRHNRKEGANGATGKAIYSGMGSIDFTASVRSEMAITQGKNGVRFLNHIKTNSGKKGNSITYDIIEQPDGTGLFKWGEFAAWPPKSERTTGIIATRYKDEVKVIAWLHDILSQSPDGELANEVFTKGALMGFSRSKLEHSKKGIVISERKNNQWYWRLDPNSKVVIE